MANIKDENTKIKKIIDNGKEVEAWNKGGRTYVDGIDVGPSGVDTLSPLLNYNVTGGTKSTRSSGTRRDNNDSITQLADLQKKIKQQELEQARKKALSDLEAEELTTNNAYKNQINQASTNADIALKNYFENVANRGQTNSGSTSQGEIAHNLAKSQNISALQQAQASALADIARRKTLANQGYTDNLESINNQIDLQTLQSQIETESKAGTNALEQAQLMAKLGDYSGLRQLGYDTTFMELQQQNELQQAQAKLSSDEASQALSKAKLMADMGDFSGLKALGYDTTQLEKQWSANLAQKYAQTAKTKNGGTNTPTNDKTKVFNQAYKYLVGEGYSKDDVIKYVQGQGLTSDEEYDILNNLGLLGGATTTGSSKVIPGTTNILSNLFSRYAQRNK